MILRKNILFLSILALLTTLAACIKTEFDEPVPCGDVVDITPNISIKALKALHITPGGYDKINDDLIIEGVVVMDDRSGNFYKTLIIQDSTSGIEVRFNDGFLYNQFPVGRKIYIRCKDLYLSDYGGLVQMTGSLIEEGGQIDDVGLTEFQVRTKIVRGSACDIVPPAGRTVTIGELRPDMVSTLIKLDYMQFIKADTGKTYANAVTKSSLNRTMEDCNGLQLILRSSGYADFAAAKTPGGNGTVTGVLGVFNGLYQLAIRDLSDVQMTGERCGGQGGGPGLTSIYETFDGTSTNSDIDLPGWVNVAVQGNRLWRGASFSGDKFASATAFSSNLNNMECWLISPGIDLSTQRTLSFETSSGYYKHDGLTVWVSTDFNGQNPATATWTQLSFTKPPANANGYSDFVPSGNITLPVFNGKGYIGFMYVGDTNTNTTTWRFDDVRVQ